MEHLSKKESDLYEKLNKLNMEIFKVSDISRISNFDNIKVYNLIKSMKNKKAIKKIGNGFYSLYNVSELEIASNIVFPGYISFWSALNYYGFSDNLTKNIFVATTKFSKNFGSIKFIKMSKKRFFGYTSFGKIVIADKEKTIIDCILFPKYCGGIKEIIRSLNGNIDKINIKNLMEYALKTESKSVLRRLGFILENLGIYEKNLKKLKNKLGKGYVLLDPNLKNKNNLNKKWLLDINI